MSVPADPRIYHITYVDNLAGMVRDGCLWSDAKRIERDCTSTSIGYSHIKDRRMRRPVPVAAHGMLGEYVPFYFCNRSVMLYVIHKRQTEYQGGQGAVVHLVSTLNTARATGRPWAFTDRHAELAHALYYDNLSHLNEVRLDVMDLTYWSEVREVRQAEFLVRDFLPWNAILEVVAMTDEVAARVQGILAQSAHKPGVAVRREWYY